MDGSDSEGVDRLGGAQEASGSLGLLDGCKKVRLLNVRRFIAEGGRVRIIRQRKG